MMFFLYRVVPCGEDFGEDFWEMVEFWEEYFKDCEEDEE